MRQNLRQNLQHKRWNRFNVNVNYIFFSLRRILFESSFNFIFKSFIFFHHMSRCFCLFFIAFSTQKNFDSTNNSYKQRISNYWIFVFDNIHEIICFEFVNFVFIVVFETNFHFFSSKKLRLRYQIQISMIMFSIFTNNDYDEFAFEKSNQKFNHSNKKRKLNINSILNFFWNRYYKFREFQFFFRFCYVIVLIFWYKIVRTYFISRFEKRHHEISIDINFRTTTHLIRFYHFYVFQIFNSILFQNLSIKKFEMNVKSKIKNLTTTFVRDFRRQMRITSYWNLLNIHYLFVLWRLSMTTNAIFERTIINMMHWKFLYLNYDSTRKNNQFVKLKSFRNFSISKHELWMLYRTIKHSNWHV